MAFSHYSMKQYGIKTFLDIFCATNLKEISVLIKLYVVEKRLGSILYFSFNIISKDQALFKFQ